MLHQPSRCNIGCKPNFQAVNVASSDISDDTMFWALHSTTINPDTQSAEYDELSKCIDGALWIQANTEEFGQRTQQG
jgi:hypothetical protein